MRWSPTIKRLIECGIPVMGHIGLTPQSIHRFGGPKVQGREERSRNYLKESALALEEAGCFAMVLELMESRDCRGDNRVAYRPPPRSALAPESSATVRCW